MHAQLSAQSLANPKNAALAAQVQTVFRGETLRGLLLNAYCLSALGIWHLRRTAPEAEVFPKLTTRAQPDAV